ncbi:MAG: polymer-forming cytoskeletal protein [Nitrospirales bacterium]
MASLDQEFIDQKVGDGTEDFQMYLGHKSRLTGVLKVQGTMRIDGMVEGEVFGSDVMQIGKTGRVEATVKASHIISQGPLRGDIFANKKIELMSPATLEGQIDTPVFLLEEGVLVNGTLKMSAASSTGA